MSGQPCPIPQQLCRAVHDLVQKRELAMAFRAGDNSVLDRYRLTDEETRLLAARDLPALYRLGVHPILLFHLSAVLADRAHYIKNVVPAIQDASNPFYDYYRRRDRSEPTEEV